MNKAKLTEFIQNVIRESMVATQGDLTNVQSVSTAIELLDNLKKGLGAEPGSQPNRAALHRAKVLYHKLGRLLGL
jgi:hypothetical protein